MIKSFLREKFLVLCVGFAGSLVSLPSWGNLAEPMGFGSRAIGLGGVGVAGGGDAFAAYLNPAGFAFDSQQRIQFNWGLAYLSSSFLPIQNVVIQNQYVSDSTVSGSVDLSSREYPNTFGQMIGFAYQLLPEWNRLTLGISAFLPIEHLAMMDTGSAYIPEYFMHRSRTQRPQIDVGVGMQLTSRLSLGVGVHSGFSLTGNADVSMNTQTNTISTMRFKASLVPALAPYFGVQYILPLERSSFTLGGVLRLPLASRGTFPLNADMQAFGNFASIDIGFRAASALYYDPTSIEVGMKWEQPDWGSKTYLQLDYQFWGGFQPSALAISQPELETCSGGGCTGLTIRPGVIPSLLYQNILVPKVAQEFRVNEMHTARVGYSFRTSVLKGVSNSNGNYLDPSRHLFSVGWGIDYKKFLSVDVPCRIDFALTYQPMIKQQVTKTPGNEAGVLSDSKIGSPGYSAGGHLLGGAVSLALAI